MNRTVKFTLIGAIALLIIAMAVYPVINRNRGARNQTMPAAQAPARQSNTLLVNAMIMQYQNLDDLFLTVGKLLPDEEVDLSFETSGKITGIYFREGTMVRKGELLAKVNDGPLQAELKKLQAQLPLARDRLFRQQSLLERDAVSQESYETVATDLETLLADIDLVKSRLEQTELRAPFDGMVGLRQVSEGAYASPTTVLTTLTKISPLKIEFSVNERQLNDIKPGTRLTFTVGTDLSEYSASVYAVESRLDEKLVTLKARALYENRDGRLKPGQTASITIRLHEYDNSLVIPGMSTVAEMGRDIVYVYRGGVAHEIEITKGMRTASSVQVLEGLGKGDTLITSGVMQLRDGMPVEIGFLAGAE